VHQNAKRRHLLFSQASTDKDEGAIRKDRAFCFMCAGHNTRSGVKLSNGPVRRTQIAELTLSPPLLRPRTDARLSDNSNITQPFPQPLHNRFPTPHQPSGTSTHPQPTFNRHATASQPRTNHNHPSWRIQERFRLNHPTSAIPQLRPSNSYSTI
jgi:hypothetical protein